MNYRLFVFSISIFIQGSFFLENLRKPRGNVWFLKRTMVKNNGESTPRMMVPLGRDSKTCGMWTGREKDDQTLANWSLLGSKSFKGCSDQK